MNTQTKMNNEWSYVKPLTDKSSIEEFEYAQNCEFPKAFKECIKENNGGHPKKNTFDTAVTKERLIRCLLSFNKEDETNIWKMNEWRESDFKGLLITFAIDHFGNHICFDLDDDSIVFWDHETGKTEFIAETFEGFLDKLYE